MISGSYLVQTIHFFRGVNDSITSATRWIHVGSNALQASSARKPQTLAASHRVPWSGGGGKEKKEKWLSKVRIGQVAGRHFFCSNAEEIREAVVAAVAAAQLAVSPLPRHGKRAAAAASLPRLRVPEHKSYSGCSFIFTCKVVVVFFSLPPPHPFIDFKATRQYLLH